VIGFTAWLPKLGFLLVGFIFVGVLCGEWMRILLGRSRPTPKLFGISAFILLWAGLVGQPFVREILLHRNLHSLRPDSIASIEVNGRSLTERDQIATVTSVLNSPQWFSVNHGGWADAVPLIIHLKSGAVQYYGVGYYLRQEGAVVNSTPAPGPHFIRGSSGYVFYQELPAVLTRAGITLPNCQSLPGGRFCSACEHPCPSNGR
jgi:hypothetical protein